MNANDVIESYVTDVAVKLPRKQRNDVAFELRALLNEELQGRAETAGRAADAAMATELVRAFGRPADVAARYRPTLTIIDPADGHAFLRASIVGLVIIWGAGLAEYLRPPVDSGWSFLTALGQWWGKALIPSLWWPGVLVVGFGAASWARRRRPQSAEWKPRAAERVRGSRVALVMGLVGILCGLFVLIDPRWFLDLFLGGREAPAVREAFTYTETFRHRQAPWVLVLILLNIPMMIAAIANGRRLSSIMRRVEMELSLVTCAVLTWTVLGGPVFLGPATDRMFKLALVLIIAITLIHIGVTLRRSVSPAPDRRIQA